MSFRQRVVDARPGVRAAWRCDRCGRVEPWGPTWAWFGSLKDEDEGRLERVLCGQCDEKFVPVKEAL